MKESICRAAPKQFAHLARNMLSFKVDERYFIGDVQLGYIGVLYPNKTLFLKVGKLL